MALSLVGCKGSVATSKVTTPEVEIQVNSKTDALKEIAEYEPRINQVLLDAGLRPIECPVYLQDTLGIRSDKSDVNTCFVSSQLPEELMPLLSDGLKAFSEVSMGWRMDLGTWTTFRKFKSNQQFSVTLTAPGLREDTRNDPKIKEEGTIAMLFMGYDPQR
ncbi:hypothetical protein [Deinococcus altitudinis]|uniref:hypothetical protein n=1 Tax=Deinococcus altitudinis TaxID=468914 RepID=UPI00389227BF